MGETFIGMGQAPDGIDLPLGLSMGLSMHPKAAATFGKMSADERHAAIRYIQSGVSSEDAKRRIASAINQLDEGQTRLS
ncbi:MAG: YdeI/OmpD-associated family protein [Oscillospiraceae bacterium]|nr:YdeI/OmpD-associated family protein [Oscillospiraceae bacterium]